MNPNSANQTWTRWTATVTVPFKAVQTTDLFARELRGACSRFYRRMFGSATELKIDRDFFIERGVLELTVDCRTEGSFGRDPELRKARMDEIGRFFGKNLTIYGRVHVHVDVRVEAGDAGDGKPPAQLIIVPPLAIQGAIK